MRPHAPGVHIWVQANVDASLEALSRTSNGKANARTDAIIHDRPGLHKYRIRAPQPCVRIRC